jgi:Tfp pilus tip-associated adhesin PilY1
MSPRTLRILILVLGTGLLAGLALADDKAILQTSGGTAEVVIILDNSGYNGANTGGYGSAGKLGAPAEAPAFGGGDSPDAKLRKAKDVLLNFLMSAGGGSTRWAIGTFDRTSNPDTSWSIRGKHFIYEQVTDDFPGQPYNQTAGHWERWGTGKWPVDPDISPALAPAGGTTRAFAQNFGQYPKAGDTAIQCVPGSVCPPTNALGHTRMLLVWQNSNHYHLISCEDGINGAATAQGLANGPCADTSGNNDFVTIEKDYQVYSVDSSGNLGWHTLQSNTAVQYRFIQGFVAVGTETDVAGTLIDDRVGAGNACGNWENQTGACPSVPFPFATSGTSSTCTGNTASCPAGTLDKLTKELQPVEKLVDINPSSGNVFYAKWTDGSTLKLSDNIEPLQKECVGNTLSCKGLAGYYSTVPSGGVCDKRYAIFITDNLQANQSTPQCTASASGGDLVNAGVKLFSIFLGTKTEADATSLTSWWKCLPHYTGADTVVPGSPGYWVATDTDTLVGILQAIASTIDENTKDFASATVSSVQTGTAQIALLANFNASLHKSIWNGRVKAYQLDSTTGQILANCTKSGVTLTVPCNDPAHLMWNAGVNLELLTDPQVMTPLASNQSLNTGTYSDTSTDTTTTIPAYFWSGRKIVFSPEQATPGSVPEVALDLLAPASYPVDPAPGTCASYSGCPWWWLKANYFGISTTQPASDTAANDDIHFIRGDRNSVVIALGTQPGVCIFGKDPNTGACVIPDANSTSAYLYTDFTSEGSPVEERLGDIFHSTPTVVGRPNNFIYYFANLNPDGGTGHDYVSFFKRLRRRRQILFAGANDGLFHAFDVGAFDRAQNIATCPDGTKADGTDPNVLGGCYDLGIGTEIFAYAPRATMISYNTLTHSLAYTGFPQEWTADGGAAADDMFLSNNSSAPAVRQWKTVLIGGLREGSRAYTNASGASGMRGSYFALDVTQPDSLPAFDPAHPDPNSSPAYTGLSTTDPHNSPGCLGAPTSVQTTSSAGCAGDSAGNAVEYPRVLWEFNDTPTNGVPNAATNPAADNDGAASTDPGAGYPDLGETWSKPFLGRIELPLASSNPNHSHPCVQDNTKTCEDKYVAIFGGGFDSERKNRRGNWLYVLDAETGNVLFKVNKGHDSGGNVRPFASVAAQPFAVDYTFDGYLDVVYVGDVNGRMWKMDLRCNPTKISFNPSAATPNLRQSIKISATGSANNDPWKPFLFFNDNRSTSLIPTTPCDLTKYSYCTELSWNCATKPCSTSGTGDGPPRSIYYAPAPVYQSTAAGGVPVLGIAFATGERDDIMGTAQPNGAPGSNYQTYRFYYVVDDPSQSLTTFTPSNLTAESPTVNADGSLSFAGTTCPSASGYYINFPGDLVPDPSGNMMIGERGISDVLAVNGYIYFSTFTPGAQTFDSTGCKQSGLARLYRIYYSYCNGTTVDASATEVGTFASNPVAYVDENGQIQVIDATDSGHIYNDQTGSSIHSRIKNWKEQ